MNKRRYQRYSVSFDGKCVLSNGQTYPCQILDLCMGGMFVELMDTAAEAAIHLDEQLTVLCTIPGTPSSASSFNASIVRAHDLSIGLVFIAPDLTLVKGLIDYARSLEKNHAIEAVRPALGSLDEVVAACQARVIGAAPALLDTYMKSCAEEILNKVDTVKNLTAQNAYFTAITMVKCNAEEFHGRFMASIRQSFEQHQPANHQALEVDTASFNELTLMDDGLFDDWLASADIVCHVESKSRASLSALRKRLSKLYGREIDAENNPFGPLIFSDALQAALKPWLFEHDVYQICFTVFRIHVVEACESLYEALNQVLIQAGILPDLHFQAPLPKRVNAPSPNRLVDAESAEDAGQSAHWGQGSLPSQVDQRTIVEIVDDIQRLREELLNQVRQGDAGASVSGAPDPDVSSQPSGDRGGNYSVDELMGALDAIHLTGEACAETGQADFLSKVDSYLQHRTGARRQFPRRERSIMDVGNRIFTSLRGDPQVSGQVQSWLQELEIPLMKLALKDDAFLMDRDHVLRRIINNVSMLELYGDDEGGPGDNAVCHKIDNLIKRIVQHRTGDDTQVLQQALRELEMLVEIQNDAYQENFNEVVRGCLEEQPLLKQARAGDPNAQEKLAFLKEASDIDTGEVASAPGFVDWLDRVHRLKLNTWIVLKDESGNRCRLKLAWVTKHLDRFVFVNLRGQKEITLTDRQLARDFMTGQAEVLDNANEPAMERAQHTMLQKLHHQLIHETTHDCVTNVLNRREFEKVLGRRMLDDAEKQAPKVLCCLDLVQFRAINESCGSAAGDRLLREVADRLRATFSEAPLARLGNDEFVILLEGDSEAARVQMDRLQNELSSETFVSDEKRYPIALNIGLVPVTEAVAHPVSLLLAAEDACRKAKQSDGDVCILASEPVEDPETTKALEWLVKVNESIRNREVHLRYQPIVTVSGPHAGAVHHSEVLLSVLGDDGQPVSPQDFVLAAERFNRMPTLDRLIVQETFAWASEHSDLIAKTGSLAINLSGKSLNDPDFLSFLMDLIQTTGVPVEHVSFEVTETAGVNSMSQASAFIETVRAAGCSFSLDDFGSGMSSYGYLKHLPVDFLKIDGAFVRAMDKNPEDFAIVKSITEIAHFMGKKVIAECVENEQILTLLGEIGVDYAQGYHVGRPAMLSGLVSEHSHQDIPSQAV